MNAPILRWIACLLMVAFCGCVSTPTDIESFDRRGTPIGWESVPAAVQDSFQRQYPEVSNHAVEKIGDGQSYRFVLPTGEIIFLDSNGRPGGGVI